VCGHYLTDHLATLEKHANPYAREGSRAVINSVALEKDVGQPMNRHQLIQAVIDLVVAIVAGYIVAMVPITGAGKQISNLLPLGKPMIVQTEAYPP